MKWVQIVPILLMLIGCYNRSDTLDWDKYVDSDTVKLMRIIEVGEWRGVNPCATLSKKVIDADVAAITVCNIVFVCKMPGSDTAYKCLLVHEAWHVKQNGVKFQECIDNMILYGYEWGASRYLEGHSGKEAYLSIEEEKEAYRREQECLKD